MKRISIRKNLVDLMILNISIWKLNVRNYLSKWVLQNGRREFNSIIRCIPMSEINTADSATMLSIHIHRKLLARTLDIWNKNHITNHHDANQLWWKRFLSWHFYLCFRVYSFHNVLLLLNQSLNKLRFVLNILFRILNKYLTLTILEKKSWNYVWNRLCL